MFRWRAQQIAQHYGAAISAYEVVNEPNINWELWNSTSLHTAEIKPERYATLMTRLIGTSSRWRPAAQVLIGGMLLGPPPNDDSHDELDWLYQLYVAPAVQAYQASGDAARPGWNVVPWDGVGLHPYWVTPTSSSNCVRVLAQKIRDRGDTRSQIWVTEIGAEATQPGRPAALGRGGSTGRLPERRVSGGAGRPGLCARSCIPSSGSSTRTSPRRRPSVPFGLVRLAENEQRLRAAAARWRSISWPTAPTRRWPDRAACPKAAC